MENSDYLDIDGRQLKILLAILEAGSLSAAGKMLDMNQSTVSYWLDLLRRRLDDPLFVRSGNGVEPTERARALFGPARETLRMLEALCQSEQYDPSEDRGTLRVAVSAVERDLLIAPFMRHVTAASPGLLVEVSPSSSTFQVIERLRQGTVDMTVGPQISADVEGLLRRTLTRIEDAVFFDPGHPLPEGDLDAFCARPQARVALGAEAGFAIDRRLARMGRTRHVALQAPDFDSVLRLIRGTPIIATLPKTLSLGAGKGLRTIKPPWESNPLTLALHWHARTQSSARHSYWRDRISQFGKQPYVFDPTV